MGLKQKNVVNSKSNVMLIYLDFAGVNCEYILTHEVNTYFCD